MQELIANMRKQSVDQRDRELFDRAYDGWKGMSVGSHPSGTGIVQTIGDSPERGMLGAVYDPELWDAGIRNGLTAAFLLAHETGRLNPQGSGWEREMVDLGVMSVNRFNPGAIEAYVRQ
jgi:hypothetical protein